MAALERFPRDGHGGDEEGGERHPQLLPYRLDQAQPPHPGHAPFHLVQDLPRGQSNYSGNPGENEDARFGFRVFGGSSPVLRYYRVVLNDLNLLNDIEMKIHNHDGRDYAFFFPFSVPFALHFAFEP